MEQTEPDLPNDQPNTTTINDLPRHANKAESFEKHKPEDPMWETRCYRCNTPMWTWSRKEDVCERCAYEVRNERREAVGKQNTNRHPVNAFVEEQGGRVPVNLDGNHGHGPAVDPFAPAPESRSPVDPFSGSGSRKVLNPFSQ